MFVQVLNVCNHFKTQSLPQRLWLEAPEKQHKVSVGLIRLQSLLLLLNKKHLSGFSCSLAFGIMKHVTTIVDLPSLMQIQGQGYTHFISNMLLIKTVIQNLNFVQWLLFFISLKLVDYYRLILRMSDRFASFEDALSTLRYPYGHPRTGTPENVNQKPLEGQNFAIKTIFPMDHWRKAKVLLTQQTIDLAKYPYQSSALKFKCVEKFSILATVYFSFQSLKNFWRQHWRFCFLQASKSQEPAEQHGFLASLHPKAFLPEQVCRSCLRICLYALSGCLVQPSNPAFGPQQP